jgi:aspartyl-tRNA(Asn)/glutamyl-tRNA(Gln) amidotransferase subunit A
LKDGADKYDPRVIVRIRAGETVTTASYIDRITAPSTAIARILRSVFRVPAIIRPTGAVPDKWQGTLHGF